MNKQFLFLPTIISSMGYRANLANLMSGAPFLAAVGNLLFQTWLSDRIKRRGQIMIQCLPFFALGFALMLAFSTTHLISRPGLRYMALFIAVSLGNVGGPISLGVSVAEPFLFNAGNTGPSQTEQLLTFYPFSGLRTTILIQLSEPWPLP